MSGGAAPAPRILVLSDTHVPGRARDLPRAVWEAAERAVLVLHAGDFVVPRVLEDLEQVAPVVAVHGNSDDPDLQARLPAARVVEHAGLRIGLVHGHEGPGRSTPERALRTFAGQGVDVVVFGHSHWPLLERAEGGTLLLNPGSPTDPRRAPAPSFAWLWVEDGAARAEHVFLSG